MDIWIVLHTYYEEIEEYGSWHNDEFVSVHRSEEAAQAVVRSQTNTDNDYWHVICRYV